MLKYVVDKLIQSIATLLIVVIAIFLITRSTGSPEDIYIPMDATQEQREVYMANFGLDKPLPLQFVYFVKEALHGNLGNSYATRKPVMDSITTRFPNTVRLALSIMLVTTVLGFALGIISTLLRKTFLNKFFLSFFALCHAIPGFFVLMLAIDIFGVRLRVLPIAGNSGFASYILPSVTMGLLFSTNIALVLRNSMVEILDSEYIKLVKLKGMKEHNVILKHVLKNASIPVIGMLSMMLAMQLTGTMITETMFAWPGIGLLTYQSVMNRDYAMVQGLVVVMTLIVIVVNFLADILYAAIDPRIRGQV